jgi:hypothetical protein
VKNFKQFFLSEAKLETGKKLDRHISKYLVFLMNTLIRNGRSVKFTDGQGTKIIDEGIIEYTPLMQELEVSDNPKSILLGPDGKAAEIFKIQGRDKWYKWTNIHKSNFGNTLNKGDLAEGIFSAAVAARFLSPNTNITENDVKTVLRDLGKSPSKQYLSIKRESSAGSIDTIEIKMSLKPGGLKNLYKEDNWNFLKDEFKSCVKFANSKNVSRYATVIDHNPTNDLVIVDSMGAVNEKGTKVDMSVKIALNHGSIEEVDLNKHIRTTRLNLSLKSGETKNLEQAGYTPESLQRIFDPLGIDISDLNKYYASNDETWYRIIFNIAARRINRFVQKNDRNKAIFMKKLANAIEEYATKMDRSVLQLHLKKGDFHFNNYQNLEDKLKDIELEAAYDGPGGTSNRRSRPYFIIRDANDPEKGELLVFRLEVRSGVGINKIHIQKGPLLSKLVQR